MTRPRRTKLGPFHWRWRSPGGSAGIVTLRIDQPSSYPIWAGRTEHGDGLSLTAAEARQVGMALLAAADTWDAHIDRWYAEADARAGLLTDADTDQATTDAPIRGVVTDALRASDMALLASDPDVGRCGDQARNTSVSSSVASPSRTRSDSTEK